PPCSASSLHTHSPLLPLLLYFCFTAPASSELYTLSLHDALPISAAASDDVDDTVHYGLLADRLVAIVTGEPVDLIETLAERLARSEEHTSELQSRFDLVCRLLLEKKNASIESYGDYNSG